MKIKQLFLAIPTMAGVLPIISLTACNNKKEELPDKIDDIWINGPKEIFMPLNNRTYRAQYDTTIRPQNITRTDICDWSLEYEDGSKPAESDIKITQNGELTVKKTGIYYIVCKYKKSDFVKKTQLIVSLDVFNKETHGDTIDIVGFKDTVTEDDIKEAFTDHVFRIPTDYHIEGIAGFVKDGKSCLTDWIEEIDLTNTCLKIIAEQTFKYSSINSLWLPPTLEIIEDRAFYGCKNLIGALIPNKVEYLGNAAFGGCSNFSICNIPTSISSLGMTAFVDCPISILILNNFDNNVKYSEEIEYPINCFHSHAKEGIIYLDQSITVETEGEWKKILFNLGLRTHDESESKFPEEWKFVRI